MKKINYFLVIVCLLCIACCNEKGTEAARYSLSDKELNLIPYSKNQKINFVHSNGYAFDFVVTENKTEWEILDNFCEWNCCGIDYISQQYKTTTLTSSYPLMTIRLSIYGNETGLSRNSISLNCNNRYSLSIPYDSTANFIADSVSKSFLFDSVLINSKTYYHVIEQYFNTSYEDTTILHPLSIIYNEKGLLQIKMSNDEKFSIK